MSRIVTHNETFTGNIVSYDTTDHAYRTYSNPDNAYGGSSSTTYAQAYIVNGQNAESWLYYNFDTSSIPNGVTITSVTCTSRCAASGNSTNTPTKWMCFFSGTTQKGTTYTLSTSTTVRTLTLDSDLTLSDIRNARVKVYVKRGTANTGTSYYIRFYGATLTVNYSYDETLYNVSGSSNSSSISFSGDGEHSSGDNVTVTITGDLTGATVTDNGVDVTSSLSGSGTTHTYTISGIAADHAIVVTVPNARQEIFVKQNGSWVAVDTVYVKQNGVWKRVESLYIKDNGRWKNDVNVISPLPDGYTEVQYIQNSGTAYIQTSISGDGSSWEITAECSSASQNEILICRATSSGNWYGILYNSGDSIWASTTVSLSTRAHVIANFISKAVNGEVNGESFTRTGTSTSTNAFQIFGYNGTYSFIGKVIGDVICKQSNNKVFHGVPCISPNNEVGLYDLVSGTFLGSSNTSTFTAGPLV